MPHNEALYKTFNLLTQRSNNAPKQKTRKHFHACGFFETIDRYDYEQMTWVKAPVQRRKMMVMPWFVKIGSAACTNSAKC